MIGDTKNCAVLTICMVLGIALFNASCSSSRVAPVSSRESEVSEPTPTAPPARSIPQPPPTQQSHYVVVKGDTLYSIAWDHNFDYKNVARWNNITEPYVIYPGQSIRLTPPTKKPPTQAIMPRDNLAHKKTNIQATGKLHWQWPTEGRLIRSSSPISRQGIDIGGNQGQAVKASASGVVVYSGSGLLRYGKLIILKHNENYMSAYAHNSLLMVKEGDRVSGGQQIAKMGQNSDGQTLLHFQIRKNGAPVAPAKHLPKIQS